MSRVLVIATALMASAGWSHVVSAQTRLGEASKSNLPNESAVPATSGADAPSSPAAPAAQNPAGAPNSAAASAPAASAPVAGPNSTIVPAPTLTAPASPPAARPAASAGANPTHVVQSAGELDVDQPEEPTDGSLGRFQKHGFVSVGFKSSLVKSSGFDPYASSDVLGYVSFNAGHTVFVSGPLSLVGAFGIDHGARNDTARGADTSLRVTRFELLPELRYHVLRQGYAFGHIGMGLSRVASTLDDRVTEQQFERKHLTFTGEIGAGFAYAVASSRSAHKRTARLWLIAEGGLLYFPALSQALTNDSGVPARSRDIELPELALTSPYYRLAAALSF
ncbi:MAG TPA: hypothetical protein VFQ61_27450 [Polyangiaceae bacterium]|nr:hypothetical protein [Polyangiaceae bacterium]